MLRNNTRIIALNPRFSKLVTREYVEKLAGTRNGSSNQNQQQRAKRGGAPTVPPVEDEFTQRLGGARNPRVGGPGTCPKQKSSGTSSSKLGHHPKFPYERAFRRRSQSLREHRSRQLLSVLHEEETSPQSSFDAPRQSLVEVSSDDNTLMRTKNAKASGSSFCRFVGQDQSSCSRSSGGHKRQLRKMRPKGFRSRVVATLVILKDHYQHLLSSLNGEEVRREYSNLGGMVVNAKYDLQFAEDLDLAQHDHAFADHEHHSIAGYRSVKVRFRRSLSCKI